MSTILTNRQDTDNFRMLTLREGLKLEISGIKVTRGTTCYAILKKMGYRGSRASVLTQMDALRAEILRTTEEA